MIWKHDDLAADLAAHLLTPGRLVWCDMQLGPAGAPRPDVYTIEKSFVRPNPISYECKISIADFRADVTAGKWQKYLAFSSGVYIAVPVGLLKKEDVPKGCGLIVRGDAGWRTLRAPTLSAVTLGQNVCLKLLIDGVQREVRGEPRRERSTWGATEKIAKKWGHEAATVISDLRRAKEAVEYLRESQKAHHRTAEAIEGNIREQVQRRTQQWTFDLCQILQIPRTDNMQEIFARLVRLRDAVQKSYRDHRDNIGRAVNLLEDELVRVKSIQQVVEELDSVVDLNTIPR